MRGSIYKRCACRGDDGKPFDRDCPKLRQSKHGSWFYDVREEGKRYRKGGFGRAQDAQDALDNLRRRLGAGDDVTVKGTAGEWFAFWLAEKSKAGSASAAGKKIRPATTKSYRQHVEQFLTPHLGHLPLDKLRPAHITAMYDEIERANAERERKVGTVTIRRIHATLRSALNQAVKARRISYNPCLHVELPEVNRPKVDPWSAEELGLFLDAVAMDRLGSMYEVMAFTGLRRGETIALRWTDIDLDNAVLFVRRQLTDFGFSEPKTRSSDGKVDLDDATVGALLAHKIAQDVEREQWGEAYDDHALVFCKPNGSPLRPEYATRHMQRLAKKAGLSRKRLHDLRHGSASLQIAAGVDLAIVSKRLRHSSISITNDTYVHLLQGVGHDAAERARAMVPRNAGPIPAPSRPEDDAATLPEEAKPQVIEGAPPGTRTPDPLIKSAGEAMPDEAAS